MEQRVLEDGNRRMNNLSRSLGTDLPTLAAMLRSKGRGKDSVLAHITPQEAALLKARGGRGSLNPATGLPEFDDVPVEAVTVEGEAPPPVETPYIAPVAPPAQLASPAATPTESVTVEGNAPAPSTPAYTPPAVDLTQATAPQVTIPASAPASSSAAPESVTVTGTNQTPTAPYVAPVSPTASPQPSESTSKEVKDWLSNNSTLLSILGLGGLAGFGAVNSSKASGAMARPSALSVSRTTSARSRGPSP